MSLVLVEVSLWETPGKVATWGAHFLRSSVVHMVWIFVTFLYSLLSFCDISRTTTPALLVSSMSARAQKNHKSLVGSREETKGTSVATQATCYLMVSTSSDRFRGPKRFGNINDLEMRVWVIKLQLIGANLLLTFGVQATAFLGLSKSSPFFLLGYIRQPTIIFLLGSFLLLSLFLSLLSIHFLLESSRFFHFTLLFQCQWKIQSVSTRLNRPRSLVFYCPKQSLSCP